MTPASLSRVDHLVYATPDLEASVLELERRLGIHATPAGQHPGRGSRNAPIALGSRCYLEIAAPDPDRPKPREPRWFRLDEIAAPKLVTWAVKASGLSDASRAAERIGFALGPVTAGSRQQPGGALLEWSFTDPRWLVAGGVVPFLIDWGTSAHPAKGAARGAELVGLRAEHRESDQVGAMLATIGVALRVEAGSEPALIATLQCGDRRIELR